jgi:hypothetical protein
MRQQSQNKDNQRDPPDKAQNAFQGKVHLGLAVTVELNNASCCPVFEFIPVHFDTFNGRQYEHYERDKSCYGWNHVSGSPYVLVDLVAGELAAKNEVSGLLSLGGRIDQKLSVVP